MKSFSELISEWIQTIKGKGIKSELARNGISSLILKISDVLFSFLIAVTLARHLGAEGYGTYSYVIALVSVLAIPAQFGLPNLLVRETAKALAKEDWGVIQGIWRWAGKMASFLVLGLILIAALTLGFMGNSFPVGQINTFVWGLILMPLIVLGELRGAALRGLHRILEGQIPEQLILPGLFFVFILIPTVIFPSINLTPASAMALQVIAAALAFFTGAWLLWRATPSEVRNAPPIYYNRLWLLSTLPLAFIGGAQLINGRISTLILGIFTDSAQVGIYRVADQMSLLIAVGLQTVNIVIAPQFARLHALGDTRRLQKLATTSARVVFFLTLLVMAAFLLFGRLFLSIVFGSEFLSAYTPLLILAVGQLINSAAGSVGVLLNMTGNEKETARGIVIAAVGNVVLNLILVPLWGIVGAALASAIALSAWNILLVLAVRKKLKINSTAFGSFGKSKDD